MPAFLLFGLVACAPPATYTPPNFAFPTVYHGVSHGVPVLLTNDAWWQRLNDPVLNQLVTAALAGNPTLAAARARVVQARAAARATPGLATLSPSLVLAASGQFDAAATGTGTLELGPSWLFDLYGANRAAKVAAHAEAEIAETEFSAARLLLLYNLGNAYVELRYRQTILALRDQEMRSRRQTLAMTRTLMDAQDATRLDITRSEARVAEIEGQMPGLRAAVAAKKNEIAVLTGVAPGALATSLDQRAVPPRPMMAPNVGIPADLLRNRPDIQIAERRYYIALAGVTEAKAALYPQLSLSGSLALNASEGGSRVISYNFGPRLQLPELPMRRARAGVTQAEGVVAEALANWKATVLTAMLEVQNAMLDYQAASAAQGSADKAARLFRETLDLTRKVVSQGDATLSDMINAEQELAAAQQAQADTLFQRGRSFIELNVRLGAGRDAGSVDTSAEAP
ncbi:MAG: efflux transporter outer membrane subunit [Paracoccaceae bacterium]